MDLYPKLYHANRIVLEFLQDQWFDRTRHVRTAGAVSLPRAGISRSEAPDSEWYVPARPSHIREALKAAPVQDVSNYTYIDLGSGKGRTLFVAAEFPFRRIVGVELSRRLHQAACANIRSFRPRGRVIESIHANAADFELPPEPLVLYLFNPFGATTMQRFLDNLADSMHPQPRHLVVILLWPRCGDQVERVPGARAVCANKRMQIFEAHADRAIK